MSSKNDPATPLPPQVKIPILTGNKNSHLSGVMKSSIFTRIPPTNIFLPIQRELKVFECADAREPHKSSELTLKTRNAVSTGATHFTPSSLSLRHDSQHHHSQQTRSSSLAPAESPAPKRSPSPEPAAPASPGTKPIVHDLKEPVISFASSTGTILQAPKPEQSLAAQLKSDPPNHEAFMFRNVNKPPQSCAGACLTDQNSYEERGQKSSKEAVATTLFQQNPYPEISSRSGSPSPHVLSVDPPTSCAVDTQKGGCDPNAGISSRYHLSTLPLTKNYSSGVYLPKEESQACVQRSTLFRGVGEARFGAAEARVDVQSAESVTGSGGHPTWQPRTIKQARPAWNQRIPPSKSRAVVDMSGSKPFSRPLLSSPRPYTARGRDERTLARTRSLDSRSRSVIGPDERLKTPSERILVGKISSPHPHSHSAHKCQSKTSPSPQQPTSILRRESRVSSIASKGISDVTPPSVRVLFQTGSAREASSTAKTSPGVGSISSPQNFHAANNSLDFIQKQLQFLQQSTRIAVERASRADARCAELEKQLRESELQRIRDREEFASSLSKLVGKVSFALEWIHNYEGDPTGSGNTVEKKFIPVPAKDRVGLDHKEYQDFTPGIQGTTPTPTSKHSSASSMRPPLSPATVFEIRS